jgi:predicted PolB exonuclease-like 3'-5' exonuclease
MPLTFDSNDFPLPPDFAERYRRLADLVHSASQSEKLKTFHHVAQQVAGLVHTEDALDLCDVLGSYVPGAKVKLDDASKILGLSGKPADIDGGRVEEMVLAGQIEEVARYCETDVVNTYRVWLVYELFRGSITAEQLAWCEKQMRNFIASRSSNNPHLRATVGIEKMDASDLNSNTVRGSLGR